MINSNTIFRHFYNFILMNEILCWQLLKVGRQPENKPESWGSISTGFVEEKNKLK